MKSNGYKGFVRERFPSEDDCLKYFSKFKWPSLIHFECFKCGHHGYCKGEKPYSRQCMKCGYDESVTANTFFHNTHYSLMDIFHTVDAIAMQTVFDMPFFKTEWTNRNISRSKAKTTVRRRIQAALGNRPTVLDGEVEVEITPLKNIIAPYKGDGNLIMAAALGSDPFDHSLAVGQIIHNRSCDNVYSFLNKHVSTQSVVDLYGCQKCTKITQLYELAMFIDQERCSEESYETFPYIKSQLCWWLSNFNHRVNLESIEGLMNEFFFLWNHYIKCEDPFNDFPKLFDSIVSAIAQRDNQRSNDL